MADESQSTSEPPKRARQSSAELKKRYFNRAGKTSFSLHDAAHLALAEKYCDVFLTSDSDFKDVGEIEVQFI